MIYKTFKHRFFHIRSSKEVIAMKNSKRIGYLIVVVLAVWLIIAATGGNDLPMILSFGVGIILALIGIALAIWETKTD